MLMYGLLERRHFLAEALSFEGVLAEQVNRYFDEDQPFRLLPKGNPTWAEVRLLERSNGETSEEGVWLRSVFVKRRNCQGTLVADRARKVSENAISGWLKKWERFGESVPQDVDPRYMEQHRRTKVYIPVPMQVNGHLIGIISLHCEKEMGLSPDGVKLMCLIAAHGGPAIVNAKARMELKSREHYLRQVLDAIPDEVAIVDEHCRVREMNTAKRKRHPRARLGDLCYRCFEYGRERECKGCYTLRAARGGRPSNSALWRYATPDRQETSFVEISAGEVETGLDGPKQAVEVVRHVGMREKMLEWLQRLVQELPHFGPGAENWFWTRVSEGLLQIGFPRCRVYTLEGEMFCGKMCVPADSFRGTASGSFSQFRLDSTKDLPSTILMRHQEMKAVRFRVNPRLKNKSHIIRRAEEWNFFDYELKEVSIRYTRPLGKQNVLSWADVPLGLGREVMGKISVDKGICGENEGAWITDSEMALLVYFGKFVSVALQAVRQTEAFGSAQVHSALEELVKGAVHELRGPACSVELRSKTIRRVIKKLVSALEESKPNGMNPQELKATRDLLTALVATGGDRYCRRPLDSEGEAKRLQGILETAKIRSRSLERSLLAELGILSPMEDLFKVSSPRTSRRVYAQVLAIASGLAAAHELEEISHRLNDLVSALELQSFLAGGRRRLVDVHVTINGALMCMERDCLRNNITVERPKPGTKMFVRCNPSQLQQAWTNLIQNSIFALKGKERENRRISITTAQRAGEVVVRVRDNGPGLPKGINVRMLGTVLPSDPCLGHGYGLWITRTVVNGEGGNFRIGAAPSGRGTEAIISLPLAV